MSDTLVDPELEDRVRRALHALAESHRPTPDRVSPPQPHEPRRRRVFVLAAAVVLLLGGVAALFAVAARDGDSAPGATEPPIETAEAGPEPEASVPAPTAPDAAPDTAAVIPTPSPTGTPNAVDDVTIDPARLRFAEPLPDGVVAFLNGFPDLKPPRLRPAAEVSSGDDQGASASFVALDGPHLLLLGTVVEAAPDDVAGEIVGEPVEVGVEGARWVDAEESAIAMPVGDRVRVVAPDDFFALATSGPFVDPAVMVEVAAAIGTTPLTELGTVPGIHVRSGSVGPEPIDAPIGPEAVTIDHGDIPSPATTLVRLDEAPTALDVLGLAYGVARELADPPRIGDVVFRGTGPVYIELVSPVDLVIVNTSLTGELDESLIPWLDFAPLDQLDASYDGTIDVPPAPAGPATGDPVQTAATSEPQSIALLEPAPGELLEIYDQPSTRDLWVAGVERLARVAEFDGDEFVAMWSVFDRELQWDASRYDGPRFDAVEGVDAFWLTPDMEILAIARPGGWRLITAGTPGSDPTGFVATIGADPILDGIDADDFVLAPEGSGRFTAIYADAGVQVLSLDAPAGTPERVAGVLLGSLQASADIRDLGDGVYTADVGSGEQVVVVPVAGGRVATITAPLTFDPLDLAAAVTVRPLDELDVPIDPGSELDELVARAETPNGRRFELRTDHIQTDECWSLTTGTPGPDGDEFGPIFGVSAGTTACRGPGDVLPDPFHLCVGSTPGGATRFSVSGVVVGEPEVSAARGGSPMTVDAVVEGGWTFFHAEVGLEEAGLPIVVEFDGRPSSC